MRLSTLVAGVPATDPGDIETVQAFFNSLTPKQQQMVAKRTVNYMDGLAWFIARSKGEPEEETKREHDIVLGILTEKNDEFLAHSLKWLASMRETFGGGGGKKVKKAKFWEQRHK